MFLAAKPDKPSADFPLFPHASGKWAKKIGGRLRYFGRWDDPDGALRAYQATLAPITDKLSVMETLKPAAKREVHREAVTVSDCCNRFLAAKERAVTAGELSQRSFLEYAATCKRVSEHFGRMTIVADLSPTSFAGYKAARQKHLGIVAVGNEVTRVKSLFRWCHDSRIIKEPLHFGTEFRKASAKSLRRHRREAGKKLLTAEQILNILDQSGVHLRAMVLLGINCGFGNTDCATLPIAAVDLASGWIDYPRPKTEVDRRVPLWPETIEALERVAARRPQAKQSAVGRYFVMPDGQPWDNACNPLPKHFRQLLAWAGISRGGFYWLRHTFETIAGGSKDQVAVNAIMGHVDSTMAATYREEIEDTRLLAVTSHVRRWLFG